MPTTKKRRSHEERKTIAEDRLIRAAIRLFAKKGYSQTTLEEIGLAAGYSRSLVRVRFGSKLALIEPLVDRMKSQFANLLVPEVGKLHGMQAILSFCDSYLGAIEGTSTGLRAVYGLMAETISLIPEARGVFQDLDEAHRSAIVGWIEEGIEDGEIPSEIDAKSHAVVVVAILRGSALQWLIDPKRIDLEEIRKQAQKIILSSTAVSAD